MAFLKIFLFAYLFCKCFCYCYALEARVTTESQHELQHLHTIQLSSLLPSSVCKPSTKANESDSSLKVVHRHGPCFKPNGEKGKWPSHTEILLQDQSRVNSIHSKLSAKTSARLDKMKEKGAATLPAIHGSVVGSGNYIVTVGIGTPKRKFSLIFDTGSDLTWTQCNIPGCASNKTCVYGIQYGDSSFSVGFFAKETLTLTSKDVFPKFLLGCGQNNRGLFRGAAGLLGLGRNKISLVYQTASKYKKRFSYCLPSSSSSTGHLTFGPGIKKSVKFTPLSSAFQGSSFYGLDMTGISVGGEKLPIATTVFSTPGTIIDSGTVITRLPPHAYTVLKTAFRQLMSKYPTAPAVSILDTCYDFSEHETITIPKISFFFNGGVEVDVDVTGIMFPIRASQVCLAFAGNSDPSDVGIFGNVQQHTLEVVYDVAHGQVGFAAGGCS
ncbi:Aspartyl protease family protein [Citrus sinensis]|uniref:Aspartyl protease family protein n=1 Tax=Citrus sinensis TaxID=2711 RepID=A0ACB8NM89_CITSI|nr:Aspartyl protease family protein [Citrus sinensis]KAH9798680.1 Aspartyl protease family protein [Citrus sinensis]